MNKNDLSNLSKLVSQVFVTGKCDLRCETEGCCRKSKLENSSNSGIGNDSARRDREETLRSEDRQECSIRTCSASELGDSNGSTSDRLEQAKGRKQDTEIRQSSFELEHSNSGRPGESQNANSERQGSGIARSSGGSTELPNTTSKRSGEISPNWEQPSNQEFICDGSQWPARPNQPQHIWEQPRTILKSEGIYRLLSRIAQEHPQSLSEREHQKIAYYEHHRDMQTQSSLGGTTHGFARYVDELRMLGNGVVPGTAEKAFRTLTEKIK